MFKWLKDDAFMNVVATWLFRAYIVCGLIVFMICIAYFGYTWIKHVKKVREFEKLLKESANNDNGGNNERVYKYKDENVH